MESFFINGLNYLCLCCHLGVYLEVFLDISKLCVFFFFFEIFVGFIWNFCGQIPFFWGSFLISQVCNYFCWIFSTIFWIFGKSQFLKSPPNCDFFCWKFPVQIHAIIILTSSLNIMFNEFWRCYFFSFPQIWFFFLNFTPN